MDNKDQAVVILGISGKIGSGKTTAARYLAEQRGFQRLSYSAMLLELYEAKSQTGSRPSRLDLQEFGILLTNVVGHSGLTAMLVRGMVGSKAVVDGIRYLDGYEYLRRTYGPGFRLLYRDIPIAKRHLLHNQRAGASNAVSFAEFQSMDKHPAEIHVGQLREHADFLLPYAGDIGELYRRLDSIVLEITTGYSGPF